MERRIAKKFQVGYIKVKVGNIFNKLTDPSHATPPIGKINPFIKIEVTFVQMLQFVCPLRFK